MRMLSSALRRNTCNGSFQDLQKCLLYALTGHISGNGSVLGFSCDLVDLINIDDSVLRTFNIVICCLNDLQKNILNILANIACLCESSGICDGKRNIQKSRQCLCKKCLTGTCRTKHQDITLLQLNVQISGSKNSLVMIVTSHRKCLLGIVLTNDIFIQDTVDLFRFQKVDPCFVICFMIIHIEFFFHDLGTDTDTFITNIRSIRTCDQFPYLVFGLMAKGASYLSFSYFICHIFLFPF